MEECDIPEFNKITSSNENINIPDNEIEECYFCGAILKNILKKYNFKECEHFYCIYCLYRVIFKNNLKEIIDQNEIFIKCKCNKGIKKLSLKEIDEIIKEKSRIDEQQIEKTNKKCIKHNSDCELFCKDCEKYICFHCKPESDHKDHTIVSITIYVRMYKEFIRGMPLKFKYAEDFKLQLDKSVDKFSKDLAEKTNTAIKKINHIIEELNMIKNDYLMKLKMIQENGLESINLMKSFYFEYYHDLSNFEKEDDIFSLRYLAHIKSEINDFEMIYSMGIINKLEEFENKIKEFKYMAENPFSLKVNYINIPTNFREVTRALGHDGAINCLAKVGNNQFISGSSDNSIKFWNLDDEELKPYEVLDKCIGNVGLLLLLKEDRLCTASYDENWIKIYDKIKTLYENIEETPSDYQYNVLVSLGEHKKPVTSMIELDKNLLVTAARDGTIIIWESYKKNYKIYDKIQVCNSGVYSLCKLKDDKFASGDADGTIKFWKPNDAAKENDNKYYCYQILKEKNKTKIRCLILLNNNYICSGDDEGNIIIYKNIDNEKYEMFWSKNLEGESITCLTQLKQGYLISGSYFNSKHLNNIFLRVWESNSYGYERKEIIKKHYKPIRSVIELDWGNIVSAADDGVIIIWKSGVLVD